MKLSAAAPAESGLSEHSPGAVQALCIIVCGSMPGLAILSLVAVLPQLMEHYSANPHHEWLVPMLLTAPSIVVVLLSSVTGAVADFWGRRKLMIASLVAFTVLGILPFWLDDLYAIFATRLAVGLAEAGILTTVNALMGDYFEGAARKKWLGWQMMLGPLIASVYVLAGGALGAIDWHAPFLMYLLGVPLLIWVVFALREPAPGSQAAAAAPVVDGQEGATFPWRITLVIGAVTLVVSLFFFLQLVQHGRIFGYLGVSSPAQIGVYVTIAGLGSVAGGWLYGRIANWPVKRSLALVFALYAVGYIGLSVAPNPYVGLAFDIVATVSGGLAMPTLLCWALAQYRFEHRGRGMGAWNACFSLAQFVSPALMALVGLMANSFLGAIGLVGGLAAVLSVLCVLSMQRVAPRIGASVP